MTTYLIPIFLIIPIVLMFIMIFVPNALGKRMQPSFSKEKKSILNIEQKSLFNILTDYENYSIWVPYINFIKVEKLENNKIKIIQTYKKKNITQEVVEVRRIENKELSLVKLENECTVLWTYILEKIDDKKTQLIIKETLYVYNPYLRFFLKYILTDENGKASFIKNIKKYINKTLKESK